MGKFITKVNNKTIRLTDTKAIRLIKKRAIKEQRSAANALAATVIEALSKRKPNKQCSLFQDKSKEIFIMSQIKKPLKQENQK